MFKRTRRKLIGIAAVVALIGGGMFGLLNSASGVETSGVVYQCAHNWTGEVRMVYNPNQCTSMESAFEIEGERWIPTPTPVSP